MHKERVTLCWLDNQWCRQQNKAAHISHHIPLLQLVSTHRSSIAQHHKPCGRFVWESNLVFIIWAMPFLYFFNSSLKHFRDKFMVYFQTSRLDPVVWDITLLYYFDSFCVSVFFSVLTSYPRDMVSQYFYVECHHYRYMYCTHSYYLSLGLDIAS